MNKICLTQISINDNNIVGNFEVSGNDEWLSFFKKPYTFQLECNQNVLTQKKSVAVIPFVANVLPIVWLMNATLELDELDEAFYNCIENVKKGYINMYPEFSFKGKINVKNIIKNTYNNDNSLVLFSGGVDAFQTLLSHIDEKPYLLTLWGADVQFDNKNGWSEVKIQIELTANTFDLKSLTIRTNFRDYINESVLNTYINKIKNGKLWYHDFQHGIAIISHASLIACQLEIGKVYISSSYTKENKGKITCASDPTIDNYVRFGSTGVLHDGYEYNRQDKVKKICEYRNKNKTNIPLRVCWESDDGNNCCHCEKCYRTIISIIAEKENPIDYGFNNFDEKAKKNMIHELRYKYKIQYKKSKHKYFVYAQERLRQNYTLKECPKYLKWFYKVRIRDLNPFVFKVIRFLKKAIHKI